MADAYPMDSERAFLESLRSHYEKLGFSYTVYPQEADLPTFLGTYRPDAIAAKPDEKIAIEVKSRNSASVTQSLSTIRSLFNGQGGWSLNVYYYDDGEPIRYLDPTDSHTVIGHLEHVRALNNAGEHSAALVLGWSLLEAALRAVDGDVKRRPLKPGTVIDTLVMEGRLTDAVAQRLRPLAELRNRTVHGDLSVQVRPDQVDTVLNAVRLALEEPEAA